MEIVKYIVSCLSVLDIAAIDKKRKRKKKEGGVMQLEKGIREQ